MRAGPKELHGGICKITAKGGNTRGPCGSLPGIGICGNSRLKLKRMRVHTSLASKSNVRQIDVLQVLRAFAVFQVAWDHTAQVVVGGRGLGPSYFGIFGVDLFFVISGFIMSMIVLRLDKPSGLATSRDFLMRRLTRIFPIYWVAVLLFVARKVASQGVHHWPNYWSALFLLPSPTYPEWVFMIGFSWTLVFEMVFYYTMSFALLFTVRKAVFVAVGALMLAIAAGLLVGIKAPVRIVVMNPMLLEFIFGAIAGLAFKKLGERKWAGRILVLAGVLLAFLFQVRAPDVATSMQMILMDDRVFGRVFTWGAAAALIVMGCVFWSPRPAGRLWKFLVVLGNSSYSAYLLSAMSIEFASRALLRHKESVSPAVGVAYEALIVSVAMLAGWISYQFVEWPLVRRLQK